MAETVNGIEIENVIGRGIVTVTVSERGTEIGTGTGTGTPSETAIIIDPVTGTTEVDHAYALIETGTKEADLERGPTGLK